MLCLLFIAISAPVISNEVGGIFVEASGIFLALLAIYEIKIKNVNITPTVKQGAELVTTGIYRIVRHPMYIAQIIAVAPLIYDCFSYSRLAAIIILSVNLIVKLNFEEKQLIKAFPEYIEYKNKTWRLLPFLY